MFSSFLCLLLPCFVWSVLPSNATAPILVPVQALNGTSRGACPFDSELLEAKQQLKTTVSSALDEFSHFADSVSSCVDLPSTSATGYYWISSTGTPPAVKMFCDFTATNPLSSCSDLPPRSPGGYYWTLPSSGPPAAQRYCNHTSSGGCGEDGSWTRVGFLNMSDPDQTCPEHWGLSTSPRRTCGNGFSSVGCNSMIFPTPFPYTRVCGRIVAYHSGASDGFALGSNLELPYLDGLSLTHGSPGSRQHVWSFVTAAGEAGFHSSLVCGCSNGNDWLYAESIPILGSSYFCDTGNHEGDYFQLNFDDPLWDGEGCGLNSTCCHFNNPPWFHASLTEVTTDDLEIRNCQALFPGYDSLVELIEIYVQ